MATSPRAWGLGPLETIANVGWATGGVLAMLDIYAYTDTNSAVGSTTSVICDLRRSNADIPAGDLLHGAIGPTMPPPDLPSKAFRDANSVWDYAIYYDVDSETSEASYEIIDRALCHCYSFYGIITSYVDPVFGQMVPFVVNYNIDQPSGDDLDGATAQSQCRFVSLHEFGSEDNASPLHVQILESHIETATSEHRTEIWRHSVFFNIDRIKKMVPKDAPYFEFVVGVGGTAAAEELMSWDAMLSIYDPISGMGGFRVDNEGKTIPFDKNGEDFVSGDYIGNGGTHSESFHKELTFRYNFATGEVTLDQTDEPTMGTVRR